MTTFSFNDDTMKAFREASRKMQQFQSQIRQMTGTTEFHQMIQRQREIQQMFQTFPPELLEHQRKMQQLVTPFRELTNSFATYQTQWSQMSQALQQSGIYDTLQQFSQRMSTLDITKIQLDTLADIAEDDGYEFVGDTLPQEAERELETALEESGLSTDEHPDEENINLFIKMIQETMSHPVAQQVAIGVMVNLITALFLFSLIKMGVDLQSVSDLNIPDTIFIPTGKPKEEKDEK
jgi:hypothetical protein